MLFKDNFLHYFPDYAHNTNIKYNMIIYLKNSVFRNKLFDILILYTYIGSILII